MNLIPIKNNQLPVRQSEFLKNMRESFEGTGVECEVVLVSRKDLKAIMDSNIDAELSKFYPSFKAIVHKHAESLSPAEFSSYRNVALTVGATHTTLADLINQAVGEIDTEFYSGIDEKIELEEIAGQPVYFSPSFGVYFWPCPNVPFSLDLWLTHPAEPPTW